MSDHRCSVAKPLCNQEVVQVALSVGHIQHNLILHGNSLARHCGLQGRGVQHLGVIMHDQCLVWLKMVLPMLCDFF